MSFFSNKSYLNATLINDTDGRANIGCRLTSVTLKKTLVDCFNKFNCSLMISSSPFLFKRNKLDISEAWALRKKFHVGNDFLQKNQVDSILFKEWLVILCKAEYGELSLNNVLQSDIVFFQPEGTLNDSINIKSLFGFLSLPILAVLLGKKLICLNGTLPFYDDNRNFLIQYLMKNSFSFSARDRITSDAYKCDFIPDAAIAYISENIQSHETKKDFVLITTGARNTEDEDSFILDSALRFCIENNLKPCVLTNNSKRFVVKKDFILSLGGVFKETAELEEAASIINKCVLHIGGRYHMAIFSLILGVPSLLYSIKTHKNVWLSEEFHNISLFDVSSDFDSLANNVFDNAVSKSWHVSQEVIDASNSFRSSIELLCENVYLSQDKSLINVLDFK